MEGIANAEASRSSPKLQTRRARGLSTGRREGRNTLSGAVGVTKMSAGESAGLGARRTWERSMSKTHPEDENNDSARPPGGVKGITPALQGGGYEGGSINRREIAGADGWG